MFFFCSRDCQFWCNVSMLFFFTTVCRVLTVATFVSHFIFNFNTLNIFTKSHNNNNNNNNNNNHNNNNICKLTRVDSCG